MKATRKPAMIGTVWVARAKLFKGGKIIATCMDTPNAIAYAIDRVGADMAKNCFGELKTAAEYADRVKYAKTIFDDKEAQLSRV